MAAESGGRPQRREVAYQSWGNFSIHVCFHSQQAAEKYLKAFLTRHQVEFPKTHDIGELLDLIDPIDRNLSDSLRDAVALTDYGVGVRYPSDSPSVTTSDAQQAVQLADQVRRAILELL